MAKAVLAFSGGLDTSYCVLYLREQGYEVTTVTVDTGGFSEEEIGRIEARAVELGAAKHHTVDGKRALYDRIVGYVIKGNVLRGGVYPLCAGPERTVQAMETVRIARETGAQAIAHGSTGAGNDQVRFDVAIRVLAPEMEIITPIRSLGASREMEAGYLEDRGYGVPALSKDYSINQGMLGTTVGGKETLGSWDAPPEEVYPGIVPLSDTPDEPEKVVIRFEKGLPVGIDGVAMAGSEIMSALDALGAKHGVGKDIHLGTTILGIKGRVAFAAPAPLILVKAHRELEKLVLSKWQIFWKGQLSTVYGDFLHEGLYFDPVMRDIEAMIDSSQGHVTGDVRVKLFKGSTIVEGTRSPYSLMDAKVAVYGEKNVLWDGRDAEGFCKIYGLASMLSSRAAESE